MKIIERYLGNTVINMTLAVTAILLALFASVQLITETQNLTVGHYTFVHALYYTLLILPSRFYTFSPIAILLGTMLGLGVLAKHSELITLNASGIPLYKISWWLLKSTLLVVIFIVFIGEVLAPRAAYLAEKHKMSLTTNGQTLVTQQGSLWIRDGHNFVYIQSILDSTHLIKVSRYEFDEQNNLRCASFAKRVDYANGSWQAYDILTSHLFNTKVNTKITHQQASHETWPFSFSPKLLHISIISPEKMTLKQLNEYTHYREKNRLNTSQYSLAWYKRLLQPFAIWVMMCLAIPFTFKHLRSLTTSLHTIAGIMTGFGFYLLNEFFGPFVIVYQWSPLLAASLPLIIFTILATILMYWAK